MTESPRKRRKLVVGVLTAFFGVIVCLLGFLVFTSKPIVAVSDQSGHNASNSRQRMFRVDTGDFKIEAPWYIFFESQGERPVILLFGEDHPTERMETKPDWGWFEISKSGNFRVTAVSNEKLRLAVMKNRRPVFLIRNWQEVGDDGRAVRNSSD